MTQNLSVNEATSMIHPTVIIEGNVQIGEGTRIGPFCHLVGPLEIGVGCEIGTGCTIGTEPEHKHKSGRGIVQIGNQTVIRENCVIHRGTGAQDTRIGSNCFIMNSVYIAHDCFIDDDVALSSHVSLAGRVSLLRGANLGMGVAVHQFSTIGGFAMIGMSTPVTKDVPPFCLAYGNPLKVARLNDYQLGMQSIEESALRLMEGELSYDTTHPLLAELFETFFVRTSRPSAVAISKGVHGMPNKPR